MPQLIVLPNEQLCPEGAVIEAEPGVSICDALLENDIEIEHACEKSCALVLLRSIGGRFGFFASTFCTSPYAAFVACFAAPYWLRRSLAMKRSVPLAPAVSSSPAGRYFSATEPSACRTPRSCCSGTPVPPRLPNGTLSETPVFRCCHVERRSDI